MTAGAAAFAVAATTISLEPEWAAILIGAIPVAFAILLWLIKITQESATTKSEQRIVATVAAKLDDFKSDVDRKIGDAVADARAARRNSEATWRNQVAWMDGSHSVNHDQIRRPPDD